MGGCRRGSLCLRPSELPLSAARGTPATQQGIAGCGTFTRTDGWCRADTASCLSTARGFLFEARASAAAAGDGGGRVVGDTGGDAGEGAGDAAGCCRSNPRTEAGVSLRSPPRCGWFCAGWKAIHDAMVTRLVLRHAGEAIPGVAVELKGEYPQGTRLTDKGLRAVSHIRALTSLHLSGCSRVTDKGLRAVGSLPALAFLDLSGCTKVTACRRSAPPPLANQGNRKVERQTEPDQIAHAAVCWHSHSITCGVHYPLPRRLATPPCN